MRQTKLPTIIIVLLLAAVAAASDILPSGSLYWNRFKEVKSVGEYAVGLSPSGLVVLAYNQSTDYFAPVSVMYLLDEPTEIKAYGDTLVVRTSKNSLRLIGTAGMPQLSELGEILIEEDFCDYAIHGNDLYLSRWFDGIVRYRIDESYNAIKTDSSMRGVLITQVDIVGDDLIAIDERNGLLRYELNHSSFGEFSEYLLLSDPASRFSVIDSMIYVTFDSDRILAVRVGDNILSLRDSISINTVPQKILNTPGVLWLINDRKMVGVDLDEMSIGSVSENSAGTSRGDLVAVDGEAFFLAPAEFGGLFLASLEPPGLTRPALERNGSVTGLTFAGGKLLVAFDNGPIDVVKYMESGNYIPDQSILEQSGSVMSAVSFKNHVAVLLRSPDRIAVISSADISSGVSDSLVLESIPGPPHKLRSWSGGVNEGFLLQGDAGVQRYIYNPGRGIRMVSDWHLEPGIRAVSLRDSTIAIAYTHIVEFYRVNSDGQLERLSQIRTGVAISELQLSKGVLHLFLWDRVESYGMSEYGPSGFRGVKLLPGAVTTCVLDGFRLYTLGPDGLTILNLFTGTPEVLASAGHGGHLLSVSNGMIATSDGGVVHLYQAAQFNDGHESLVPESMELMPNYPNPFNSATTINIDLSESSRLNVTVFNILGREVRHLLSADLGPGIHRIDWDGADNSGIPVASGIYFYKLETDRIVRTRKMILLK